MFFSSFTTGEGHLLLEQNYCVSLSSTETSNTKLNEAEHKTNERKDTIDEKRLLPKLPNVINKFLHYLRSAKSVSVEDNLLDEPQKKSFTYNYAERPIVTLDINNDQSVQGSDHQKNIGQIEQRKSAPIPLWINDQVYGDKVSALELFLQFE